MESNLEKVRGLACSVCLRPAPSEPHHWKTRGSGGSDDLENLVSLCREHHREFHDKGRKTFWVKYRGGITYFRKLHKLPPLESLEDEMTKEEILRRDLDSAIKISEVLINMLDAYKKSYSSVLNIIDKEGLTKIATHDALDIIYDLNKEKVKNMLETLKESLNE